MIFGPQWTASRYLVAMLTFLALLAASCGRGESVVEPGPGETDDSTTTTTTQAPDDEDDDDDGEVVTEDAEAVESTSTTVAESVGGDGEGESPGTTFIVNEDSENAAVYTELAVSGLVLTVEEQTCADTAAGSAVEAGSDETDAVIGAVQECASPKAVDDFASNLIFAGGQPLPPTEAACVSSKLQSVEEYRPFWLALLEEEPFDFLLADLTVQNRYLDLYADCVSVGRAVAQQANTEFSPPTMGCIDDLYNDREFVRVTIEADLSGDEGDLARIDRQLSGCLTDDERDALAAS